MYKPGDSGWINVVWQMRNRLYQNWGSLFRQYIEGAFPRKGLAIIGVSYTRRFWINERWVTNAPAINWNDVVPWVDLKNYNSLNSLPYYALYMIDAVPMLHDCYVTQLNIFSEMVKWILYQPYCDQLNSNHFPRRWLNSFDEHPHKSTSSTAYLKCVITYRTKNDMA